MPDAFHLNSTGPFGTRIYFLTKQKMLLFDKNNETRIFFLGRKKFFLRFIGNFVFGVKIYFFNYSRELFFQLPITSSKIDRFWKFLLLNVCNNLDYRTQLWKIACWLLLIFYLAINKNFNLKKNSISRKVYFFSLRLFSH